jgi:hypothetical protein
MTAGSATATPPNSPAATSSASTARQTGTAWVTACVAAAQGLRSHRALQDHRRPRWARASRIDGRTADALQPAADISDG